MPSRSKFNLYKCCPAAKLPSSWYDLSEPSIAKQRSSVPEINRQRPLVITSSVILMTCGINWVCGEKKEMIDDIMNGASYNNLI